MEIHPPHAIHSVKDFALQLLTITVGILIALTLEGIVQWAHHRQLVHEAEANLTTEIRENQAELAKGTQDLNASEQELEELVALVHALQKNRNTPVKDIHFDWTLDELHATSWNTAGATGAIAHMDYSQVKRYTRIYDLQQQFMTTQNRAFDAIMGVYGLTTLLNRDMRSLSSSELSQAEHVLGLALANARAVKSLEKALDAEYAAIFKH